MPAPGAPLHSIEKRAGKEVRGEEEGTFGTFTPPFPFAFPRKIHTRIPTCFLGAPPPRGCLRSPTPLKKRERAAGCPTSPPGAHRKGATAESHERHSGHRAHSGH